MGRLNEIINEEQVFVLISRGFDQNIAAHRERLGLRGDTLGELIEALHEEDQDRFRAIHNQLRATLDTVKELNDKCQTMTRVRIRALDVKLSELGHTPSSPAPKPPAAPKKTPPPKSGGFSKSI